MNECDTAKIREMTPMTHSFVHMPREDRRGGGVGLMIGKTFKRSEVEKQKYMRVLSVCKYLVSWAAEI